MALLLVCVEGVPTDKVDLGGQVQQDGVERGITVSLADAEHRSVNIVRSAGDALERVCNGETSIVVTVPFQANLCIAQPRALRVQELEDVRHAFRYRDSRRVGNHEPGHAMIRCQTRRGRNRRGWRASRVFQGETDLAEMPPSKSETFVEPTK